MTPAELEQRWQAIARELAEIDRARILPIRQGISEREGALLEEQDAIEFELGMRQRPFR